MLHDIVTPGGGDWNRIAYKRTPDDPRLILCHSISPQDPMNQDWVSDFDYASCSSQINFIEKIFGDFEENIQHFLLALLEQLAFQFWVVLRQNGNKIVTKTADYRFNGQTLTFTSCCRQNCGKEEETNWFFLVSFEIPF